MSKPAPPSPSISPSDTQPPAVPIVFFDGVCGLCNGFVDWLMSLGAPTQHIMFTPLQGKTALQTLDRASIQDLSSVVFTRNGETHRKSTAILMVVQEFSGFQYLPLRLLARVALLLPKVLRDGFYDWIAKRRYEFFGKKSTCRIPSAAERSRFLP